MLFFGVSKLTSHQAQKAKRKVIFKRADEYVKEYLNAEKEEIRLKREARKTGDFYVPAQPKVYFVVRLKGCVPPLESETRPLTLPIVSPRLPPSPRRSSSFSDSFRSTTVSSFVSPRLPSKCLTLSTLTSPTVRLTSRLSESLSTSEATPRLTASESPSPTTPSLRSSSASTVSSVSRPTYGPLSKIFSDVVQVLRTSSTRLPLAVPTSSRPLHLSGPSSSPTPPVAGGPGSSSATLRVVTLVTGRRPCPSSFTRWFKEFVRVSVAFGRGIL